LPPPSTYWDYRYILPYLVSLLAFLISRRPPFKFCFRNHIPDDLICKVQL
jgi:hypothetical protein